jgi:hypothetical protein
LLAFVSFAVRKRRSGAVGAAFWDGKAQQREQAIVLRAGAPRHVIGWP